MKSVKKWALAIDQASNCAGVSLWLDNELVAVTTLDSDSSTHSMAKRLQTQVPQLTKFLSKFLKDGETIERVLFEGVRSRLVLITVGAFLTCPYISTRLSPTKSFVESRVWKSWAKKRGATAPVAEVKGVKSLYETGWSHDTIVVDSEDIADSIMIFLADLERTTKK